MIFIQNTPATGFKGITKHWRIDLIAAFSVSLVALPLSIGIALSSGVSPMAGIMAAIIGGTVTTLLRSSHVAINGPANSLIVVVATGVGLLNGYQYLLAAFIVAGGIQIVIGLLKWGKISDLLPVSVIQGMLAAIGVMILSKELHVALGGVAPKTGNTIQVLMAVPATFMVQNPFITIISTVSLIILVAYSRFKNKVVQFVPAPVWVLLFAIPLVFLFNFFKEHTIPLFNKSYQVGPQHLVNIPKNLKDGFVLADFSKISTVTFWVLVLQITLLATIESLVSSKAIEKIDPYKRPTHANQDLAAVGFSTVLSGLIGGLPTITVVARSSVNVNNGALTKWSNFYHGIILLIFVVFFGAIIREIPRAALSAILIYTGYKLAAPRVFKDAYRKGWEQLAIMLATLLSTLFFGLLWGIFTGILFTLGVHHAFSRKNYQHFFSELFRPNIIYTHEAENTYHISIVGIANFYNLLRVKKLLDNIGSNRHIILDFAKASVVDFTLLEYTQEYARNYYQQGGQFDIVGLNVHQTTSNHPNALHALRRPKRKFLNPRQLALQKIATQHSSSFRPEIQWDNHGLKKFPYFRNKILEYKTNTLQGLHDDFNTRWEIFDITFVKGLLSDAEVYYATVHILYLPFKIPVFVLEKEVLLDKLKKFAGYGDINFKKHKEFSSRFLLKGVDKAYITYLFNEELIHFLQSQETYHLESNGTAICIFKNIRYSSPTETENMLEFGRNLLKHLKT
ncbi:SulP family inorganic anion transporter [uncultured Microscilla sp.]|uniref:SulP family inorganic anion transporter n=1 Tax=uncultured Microscilla sp. TaxID=432653 RepID=UPI002631BBE4|nr:SulP family inorganic anion transporter [uncultured Microscilla sp.]